MTQPRVRRLLAATMAATALSLAACAPPGQEGQPGVAAVYNGHTFTSGDLDAVQEVWITGTDGNDVPRRDQILTLELIRESAIAAVRERGYALTDQEMAGYAERWLQFERVDADPTPELIDAVRGVYAVAALVALDPDLQVLYGIALDVEEKVLLSPRSGRFSADTFMQSVEAAREAAVSRELGAFFFVEFQHVNGLERVETPWIDNG
jgi:hypothetical protein